MYILIVGSTGVLGREAARQLLVAGHKVRAMARDVEKAADLRAMGGRSHSGRPDRPRIAQKSLPGSGCRAGCRPPVDGHGKIHIRSGG